MKLTRWLAGAVAALGFAIVAVPGDRVEASGLASPASIAAIKDATDASAIQVRFGGHFGGHMGGHFGGFHGGFGHFHGRGFGPRFYGPSFYAYDPYYYGYPLYRCPVVWTAFGPRRICGFHRRYWAFHHRHWHHGYWRHRHFHRHYVHRYRHHRWM